MSTKIKTDNIRKEYEDLEKDDLLDEVVDKILEIEKLKRKLKKYENAHTPSSKIGYDKPQAQGVPVGRKKGKKYDQIHTSRPKDLANRPMVYVTADCNPVTGNINIRKTGFILERQITDIAIEKIVTPYTFYQYEDIDTHELFYGKHPDVPDVGIFGKTSIAFANLLHFEHRVTLAGIADIFSSVLDIKISPPTVKDMCSRASDKATSVYSQINVDLQQSAAVNADETGSNLNGKTDWLWGFFTPMLAYFVFSSNRGKDIIEKVLKDFNGTLGCDGWIVYKSFSESKGILLQRCWAHLIREVKKNCKGITHLDPAYTWICDIFDKMQKLRKNRSYALRLKGYHELVTELDRWCQVYYAYRDARDLVTKVRNGKEAWFTCVLNLEIEPTNNIAERGLRKFVVIRKIIGCLRSNQGRNDMQVMLSVLQTWRLQGLNPYKELRSIL